MKTSHSSSSRLVLKETSSTKHKHLRVVLLLTILSLSYVSMLSITTPSARAFDQGRPINIYVVDIPSAQSSWVASRSDVYQGVVAARSDAVTNTPVKLSGEMINVQIITSEEDLENKADNPSGYAHSVFINAHGEVLPVPGEYAVAVSIVSPTSTTLKGTVVISARVTPADHGPYVVYMEVVNLPYYVDEWYQMSYDQASGTYRHLLNTRNYPDGSYNILVQAKRSDQNSPAYGASNTAGRGYVFKNYGGPGPQGGGVAASGWPVPIPPQMSDARPYWQVWIDRIALNCRSHGWIWAHVAGYPFYYVGNTIYWPGKVTVGAQGLKQFLGDASASASRSDDALMKSSLNAVGFTSRAFTDISHGVYRAIARLSAPLGSHPISQSDPLLDFIGYCGESNYEWYSTAMVMSGSNPGIYVHSGLASNAANGQDADGSGVADSRDSDWFKGYAAAAIAIEEARSYLMETVILAQIAGSPHFSRELHSSAFTVTMVPGYYEEGSRKDVNTKWHNYTSIRLRVAMRNNYKGGFGPIGSSGAWCDFLSQVDVWASSNVGGDMEFFIDEGYCGLETGGTSTSLMEGLWWWAVGIPVGALSVYLGAAIGLLPIITQRFQPSAEPPPILEGSIIQAYGTMVDPDGDGWGTSGFEISVYFYKEGLATYSFSVGMTSWTGHYEVYGIASFFYYRVTSLQSSCGLSFDVSW